MAGGSQLHHWICHNPVGRVQGMAAAGEDEAALEALLDGAPGWRAGLSVWLSSDRLYIYASSPLRRCSRGV